MGRTSGLAIKCKFIPASVLCERHVTESNPLRVDPEKGASTAVPLVTMCFLRQGDVRHRCLHD